MVGMISSLWMASVGSSASIVARCGYASFLRMPDGSVSLSRSIAAHWCSGYWLRCGPM